MPSNEMASEDDTLLSHFLFSSNSYLQNIWNYFCCPSLLNQFSAFMRWNFKFMYFLITRQPQIRVFVYCKKWAVNINTFSLTRNFCSSPWFLRKFLLKSEILVLITTRSTRRYMLYGMYREKKKNKFRYGMKSSLWLTQLAYARSLTTFLGERLPASWISITWKTVSMLRKYFFILFIKNRTVKNSDSTERVQTSRYKWISIENNWLIVLVRFTDD